MKSIFFFSDTFLRSFFRKLSLRETWLFKSTFSGNNWQLTTFLKIRWLELLRMDLSGLTFSLWFLLWMEYFGRSCSDCTWRLLMFYLEIKEVSMVVYFYLIFERTCFFEGLVPGKFFMLWFFDKLRTLYWKVCRSWLSLI